MAEETMENQRISPATAMAENTDKAPDNKDEISTRRARERLKAKAKSKPKTHRRLITPRFARRTEAKTKQAEIGGGGSVRRAFPHGAKIREDLGMFRTEREYKQAKRECLSIQRRLHRAKRRLLLELAEERTEERTEADRNNDDARATDPSPSGAVGSTADAVAAVPDQSKNSEHRLIDEEEQAHSLTPTSHSAGG